ncbi:hypothetical protein IQ22_03489 [Pseudomonas duriflava]|uniref:Uncharacterized protein n=1 Tax=Pseudomonas duriflava TaxID=459528 RepID=A0A562Q8J2_9PSED|nr:hypothetical protein [Pseudomonas duriflava]TWI52346.1 hypothetical protein IQ22_03489 [Pseudomonas duriflava]
MHTSAEIRWFWPSTLPEGLFDWFCHPSPEAHAPGGGQCKTHCYLRDNTQAELGMKYRPGKPEVEVKGLVERTWARLNAEPFAGPVELWSKWTSQRLHLQEQPLIALEKRRWLRLFTTSASTVVELALNADEGLQNPCSVWPTRGCTIELTELRLDGTLVGWTLGLEAFGTLAELPHQLHSLAQHLAAHHPPAFGDAIQGSYPVWLQQFA